MSGEPHVRIDRGRLAEPRSPGPDGRETFGPALDARDSANAEPAAYLTSCTSVKRSS